MAVKDRHIEKQIQSYVVGNIRVADAKVSEKQAGKPRETFRLTSNNRNVLEAAVEAGLAGEVIKSPTLGPGQYEILTNRSTLKGFISTMPIGDEGDFQSLSLQYELWRDRVTCMRRCDGETCRTWNDAGEPIERECMCPEDQKERARLAIKGEACRLKARFKIMLTEFVCPHLWQFSTGSLIFMDQAEGFAENMRRLGIRDGLVPVTITLKKIMIATAPGKPANTPPVVEIAWDPAPINLPAQLAEMRRSALSVPAGAALEAGAPQLAATNPEQPKPASHKPAQEPKAPPKHPGSGEALKSLEFTVSEVEAFKKKCIEIDSEWGGVVLAAVAAGLSRDYAIKRDTTTFDLLMHFAEENCFPYHPIDDAPDKPIDAEFTENKKDEGLGL